MFLSNFSVATAIMEILGGLGLFLFGMTLMGDSLKSLAGNRMRSIIEKTTNTPLKGILMGTLMTVLIQSSSGTTALTVGLVRSGLMTFPQAIGVIMGANIGTTVTSFLVGLNVQKYAMAFVALGAVVIFFARKKKTKELGNVILGFGLLFFGLKLMGDSLKDILIQYQTQAERMFSSLSDWPILGLLVGTVITGAVQSSAAIVSIIQTLYSSGQIALVGALPLLLGSNIGTTTTALIASSGSNVEGKRTAMVHVLFNVIGTVIFMICLSWAYVPLMNVIEKHLLATASNPHPAMTIAMAHLVFNLVTSVLLFAFVKQLAALTIKLVPGKSDDVTTMENALMDYSLIKESPALALGVAKKAIDYMGGYAISYFELTKQYCFKNISDAPETGMEYERKINILDKRIHDYLIKLTEADITLSKQESTLLSKYLDTIKDLERLGDHCTNIVEYFTERYEGNVLLSEEGASDIAEMYEALDIMVHSSIDAINNWDKEKAKIVTVNEDMVDEMEERFKLKHYERVNSGACDYSASDHYVELLSDLERIGDHTMNIALNVINNEYCENEEYNH